MSDKKDEKRLDEIISLTINTGKPRFDPEKWKQKYPEEFQMLQSMSKKDSRTRQPSIWRTVRKRPITKIAAAAAVIIIAIGFFIVHQRPSEQADTTTVSKVTESLPEMLTVASLNIAYRKGGLEAAEAQFEKVHHKRKTQATGMSAQELLEDFNG